MFEFVPAADLDRIIAADFGPALQQRGFEMVGRRKWVRSSKRPIRELFLIQALKGRALSPYWGFSLDYVPHVSRSAVGWHRTPKSARLDLRFDPLDYESVNGRDPERWVIPSINGLERTRVAASRCAREAVQVAEEFWNLVETVYDLPQAFELQRNRPSIRFSFYNYVQHLLAYAFTLVKIRRESEAEKELRFYLENYNVPNHANSRLKQLFAEALRQPFT